MADKLELNPDFTLDPLQLLTIDMAAAVKCNDDNPEYVGRLIDILTEEHIKHGIREFFKDTEGWDENLMPQALALYHKAKAFEAIAEKAVHEMLKSMFGSVIPEHEVLFGSIFNGPSGRKH